MHFEHFTCLKKYTHTAYTEVGEGNTVKLGRGMEASGLDKNHFKSITLSEISEFPKTGVREAFLLRKRGPVRGAPAEDTRRCRPR